MYRFRGFQKALDAGMKDATASGIDVASKKKLRSEITEEEEVVLELAKEADGREHRRVAHVYNVFLHRLLWLKNFSLSENGYVDVSSFSRGSQCILGSLGGQTKLLLYYNVIDIHIFHVFERSFH